MGKLRFRVSIGDILFCISMVFVVGFPNPSIFKALAIIAFFGYTVAVSFLRRIKTQNAIQYIGWFCFLAFCHLSKMWSKVPAAADDVLMNLLWSVLISIAIVNYVAIYELSIMDMIKRVLVIILVFFADVIFNGGYVEGRYTIVIGDYMLNENVFGQITIGFAAYMLYWFKKNKRNPILIGGILLILVSLSLASGSRKSLVSLVIFILLFALCEYPPKSMFKLIARIFCGVAVVAIFCVLMMNIGALRSSIGVRIESMFEFFEGNVDADGSLATRALMLKTASEMFFEKPILGHGINSFAYTTEFGAYAHNNYMELLANVGIVGFALYYIPILSYFAKAVSCWRAKHEDSIFSLAVILVYILNDFVMVSYSSMVSQAFLAIAIGLSINMRKNSSVSHKTIL